MKNKNKQPKIINAKDFLDGAERMAANIRKGIVPDHKLETIDEFIDYNNIPYETPDGKKYNYWRKR